MNVKNKLTAIILLLLVFTAGCVTVGTGKINLKEDLVINQYDTIRNIVIEEAANNGFPTLRTEVKPLEINKWSGKLYFAVKTSQGWDNLTVKIKKVDDHFVVDMTGAATKANPKGAIEAIKTRLGQL